MTISTKSPRPHDSSSPFAQRHSPQTRPRPPFHDTPPVSMPATPHTPPPTPSATLPSTHPRKLPNCERSLLFAETHSKRMRPSIRDAPYMYDAHAIEYPAIPRHSPHSPLRHTVHALALARTPHDIHAPSPATPILTSTRPRPPLRDTLHNTHPRPPPRNTPLKLALADLSTTFPTTHWDFRICVYRYVPLAVLQYRINKLNL